MFDSKTPASKIEHQLFLVAEEFNRQCFSGACQVTQIRFAQFHKDFRGLKAGRLEGITLGLYDLEAKTIYLNRFFLWSLRLGLFFPEVRFVIYHELCHAFLICAAMPERFGLYKPLFGHHGFEFTVLEERYPGDKPDLDYVAAQIHSWMKTIPY